MHVVICIIIMYQDACSRIHAVCMFCDSTLPVVDPTTIADTSWYPITFSGLWISFGFLFDMLQGRWGRLIIYKQQPLFVHNVQRNCFKPLSNVGSSLIEAGSSCSLFTFSDFKWCSGLIFAFFNCFFSRVLAVMYLASTLFSLRISCSGVSSVEF